MRYYPSLIVWDVKILSLIYNKIINFIDVYKRQERDKQNEGVRKSVNKTYTYYMQNLNKQIEDVYKRQAYFYRGEFAELLFCHIVNVVDKGLRVVTIEDRFEADRQKALYRAHGWQMCIRDSLYSIQRLGERTNLVHLDKDRVSRSHLDALLQELHVRNKEVCLLYTSKQVTI